MPGLKLYVDYFSQPCRSVLALCELKKISAEKKIPFQPFEIIQLRVNQKQHKTEHYKKINRLQMVPALVDTKNHITMGESHTIMRYLSRRYQNQRAQLYPVWDVKRVTKIDEYLDYHHLGVRSKLFSYILNTVSATLREVDNTGYDLDLGKEEVEQSLRKFNEVFLNQKYIVGDEMSIADLSAYYEITFLSLVNYNFSKWAKIHKWIKTMEETPEILSVNKIFLKMAEKIKNRVDPAKAKEFEF